MDEILAQSTVQTDDGEYTLRELFAEMHRLNELMRLDQANIDRLKVETRALKDESLRLKTETREILARLEARF